MGLPPDCARGWLDQYLKGLSRAARKFDCPLAGGDTTRFKAILINVSVVGEVKSGTAVKRSGACVGDRIFVSGRLGEAELGLGFLRKGIAPSAESALLQRHLYPIPRIALGSWLASNRLATAMMDLSDGLSSDLARLCSASGTGARIFAEKLPFSGGAFARRFDIKQRFDAALHGGDDYELLFCVKRNQVARIPRRFAGVELAEIGEVTARTGIALIDSFGNQSLLEAAGWDPFRK